MAKVKSPSISRRRPPRQKRAIVKHARHVGEIMIAWNTVHSYLFLLFWALTGKDRYEAAHGVWHCIHSDKTQREMLIAMAEGTLASNSRMLERIKWLVDRTSDLSPYRNDPAHTSILFTIEQTGKSEIVPDPGGRKAAVARQEAEPTARYWERVRGDLTALFYYASALYGDLMFDDDPKFRIPLPRRPRLLAVPTKTKKARPKSRPQGASKRKPPPRP